MNHYRFSWDDSDLSLIENASEDSDKVKKGGEGSGHFGHAGIPGQRGGSSGGKPDIGSDKPETSTPEKLQTFQGIKDHLATETKVILSAGKSNLRDSENYARSVGLKRYLQNETTELVHQWDHEGTPQHSYIATPKSERSLNNITTFALNPHELDQESVIVVHNGIAEMRYQDKRPSEYALVSEMKEAPDAKDHYSKLGNTKYELDFKYTKQPNE